MTPEEIGKWEASTGMTWRIEGVGHEVLAIPLESVRELGELPADVQVMAVVRPPYAQASSYSEWVPDPIPRPPYLYLHISHRYCIRCQRGAPMCYTSLEEFLQRYEELTAQGR